MTVVDIISLYAIISIWLLMILNVILSIGGFIYYMKVEKTDGRIPLKEYPMVSILVPAHNESLVIVRTVRALLNFNYPKDRYEIIVVNDNSTDDTTEKLEEIQREFPDRREDLLANAGYTEFPQTWEEFWECLDALKQEGITPLALHGAGTYWVPMLLATAYIYGDAEGKDFLDERLPDSYQNEEMRKLMEFLRRLYGYTFHDALELDYDQTAARFIDGQAALIANGRWMFETIGEENYEKYRFAPFPGGILMNSPQMSAWAVTKGYSDEVTEGAVMALEFRIRCAQDTQDVSDGSTLMDSYIAATEMDYRVMPNFQLQWEQEIQNEFFTEYMPKFLEGEIQTDEFLKMMDEKVEEIRSKK